jgi:hypothetical protein
LISGLISDGFAKVKEKFTGFKDLISQNLPSFPTMPSFSDITVEIPTFEEIKEKLPKLDILGPIKSFADKVQNWFKDIIPELPSLDGVAEVASDVASAAGEAATDLAKKTGDLVSSVADDTLNFLGFGDKPEEIEKNVENLAVENKEKIENEPLPVKVTNLGMMSGQYDNMFGPSLPPYFETMTPSVNNRTLTLEERSRENAAAAQQPVVINNVTNNNTTSGGGNVVPISKPITNPDQGLFATIAASLF